MSKSFYMQCKSLNSLPKFAWKTQRIQIVNGQFVSVLLLVYSYKNVVIMGNINFHLNNVDDPDSTTFKDTLDDLGLKILWRYKRYDGTVNS